MGNMVCTALAAMASQCQLAQPLQADRAAQQQSSFVFMHLCQEGTKLEAAAADSDIASTALMRPSTTCQIECALQSCMQHKRCIWKPRTSVASALCVQY